VPGPEAGAQLVTPIKPETISIYRKLGASSRSQVVLWSRDLGLLDQWGAGLSLFHPVGAMPLRATRWIVVA
jgi:hypothetical protein